MLFDESEMTPISGVRIAPPMIAMTINDPPTLLSAPRPWRPRAKIVGYMRDMKKLVAKSAQTPIHPG
jgi:hypothetical protein